MLNPSQNLSGLVLVLAALHASSCVAAPKPLSSPTAPPKSAHMVHGVEGRVLPTTQGIKMDAMADIEAGESVGMAANTFGHQESRLKPLQDGFPSGSAKFARENLYKREKQ